MEEYPIVTQEIQDMLDGKLPEEKAPISGNMRIIEEMEKQRQAEDRDA